MKQIIIKKGIGFLKLARGMIVEVFKLRPLLAPAPQELVSIGEYLVVDDTPTNQTKTRSIMEVKKWGVNGRSALTFYFASGGISMFSFSGRKVSFRFRFKRWENQV